MPNNKFIPHEANKKKITINFYQSNLNILFIKLIYLQ